MSSVKSIQSSRSSSSPWKRSSQSRSPTVSVVGYYHCLRLTWGAVTLVNKDQLDILATLRESVNEDKAEMESEIKELRDQIKELSDKNRMQLEQVNGLLLEKVSLQSEGIDQRDRMLQRERAIGCVTACRVHRRRLMGPWQ